jgi:hypothetical protein
MMLTTPSQIRWFHMRTQLAALKMEIFGMKHSKGSVYQHIKKTYNLTGTKVEVYGRFAEMVNEAMTTAQG